jgi:hypothetical protein
MRNHSEILPDLIARVIAYLKVHSTMDHYRWKLLVVEADRIRIPFSWAMKQVTGD